MENQPDRRTAAGWTLLCLAVTLLAVAGCANQDSPRQARLRAATLIPPPSPPFLNGSVALLLTTLPGFSCHLTMQGGPMAAPSDLLTGELFGCSNKLFFAPAPSSFGGRAGGFGFLYDIDQGQGFMLCDAMQGYAPISSRFSPTDVAVRPLGKGGERVAGHRCEPVEVVVSLADAPRQVLRVWRALDLQKFPVRISTAEGRAFDLTLSRIRLEIPPAEMFRPPEGFARYESPEGMMAEMVMRQEKLKRKPGEEPLIPEVTPQSTGR